MQYARKLLPTLLGLVLALTLTSCPSPWAWAPMLVYTPSGVCPEGVQMTIRSQNPEQICRVGHGDDEPMYTDCKMAPPNETEWHYTFAQKGLYEFTLDEQATFYTRRFQADWTFTCLGTNRPSLTFSQEVSAHPDGYFLLTEDPNEPTGLRLEISRTWPGENP